jgi:hypothetical protein
MAYNLPRINGLPIVITFYLNYPQWVLHFSSSISFFAVRLATQILDSNLTSRLDFTQKRIKELTRTYLVFPLAILDQESSGMTSRVGSNRSESHLIAAIDSVPAAKFVVWSASPSNWFEFLLYAHWILCGPYENGTWFTHLCFIV